MRTTFIDTILESARTRDDVFIISGDAGLGVFDGFAPASPRKFLNLGVAEQNAIGFAAGLGLAGFKVFVYNIIPFVLYRCYEQVRNDVCYQKLPVVLVGIGSGVTYAPQGMTHYSIEDIGLCRTLPNLQVFSPCDPVEARLAARAALSSEHPVYVRLAKKGEPVLHQREDFDVTLPQLLAPGSDAAIVFHGSIASEAFKARELLGDAGISVRLISVPLVQPLNPEALSAALRDVRDVVCVEEHYVNCGLGASMQFEFSSREKKWDLHCLGIRADFIHEIKDAAGMREHFGISGEKLAEYIQAIVKNRVSSSERPLSR